MSTPENAPYEQEFFDFLKNLGILDEFIEKTISSRGIFILAGSSPQSYPQSYIAGAFIWDKEYKKWDAISRRWNEKLDDIQQQERNQ